jgi:hypothetical protein
MDNRVVAIPQRKYLCLLGWLMSAIAAGMLFVKATWPPSGHVEVIYAGLSDKGVWIDLENGSTQPLFISGIGNEVQVGSAFTDCRTSDYTSGSNDRNVLSDGYESHIRISPGSHVRLNVLTTLINQYKDGHCHVRIEIRGGSFVESREFTPN